MAAASAANDAVSVSLWLNRSQTWPSFKAVMMLSLDLLWNF